ncbi:hypothetical protein [Streptomyces sp. URMC 129]
MREHPAVNGPTPRLAFPGPVTDDDHQRGGVPVDVRPVNEDVRKEGL